METKETLITEALSQPLTLEAITRDKIFEAPSLRHPHWMRNGKSFSFLDTASEGDASTVWIYNIDTGKRREIAPASALKIKKKKDEDSDTLTIPGYQWSPDETRLLFARIPHWRSDKGDSPLYIYDTRTGVMNQAAPTEEEHRGVKWSPDGKYLGYVKNDDIYLLDLDTSNETRLTNTAAPQIYNGRFGWVYEEELSLIDGWSFSPDGKHISYFHVDERDVPNINLPDYDDLHMKAVHTRYPMAGDPNPQVRIGIISLPVSPSGTIPVTKWVDIGQDSDIYIAWMQWTPQSELMLQRIPRRQNRIDLLLANPGTGESKTILTEKSGSWVDAPDTIHFAGETNQFLWPSDRDGYNHLYLYNTSGQLVRQVTQGDWDVDNISGIDSVHRVIYFTAAKPSPLQRQIFGALLDGGADITQISEEPGVHSPLFSPDAGHYLDTSSNISKAPHVNLHRSDGKYLHQVHSNPMPKLKGVVLGKWEFTTFKTSDGLTLNAALLKPADFNPKRKYPVMMYTYGGPGSQVVQDQYGSGNALAQLLATKGYIFAMVDGRGSGMRGRDFMKITYQNLGHYEVEDQIAGAKWLSSLPYIDGKRIGIWGWSYGGYMSSLCILRGSDTFRVAISVAPVTNWEFYDSIYTERYMLRPVDNPKGYQTSSPISYADKLTGKFLIVHGSADDNVHIQNTFRLIEEFQKHDKQFELMVYPGKHHGMEGVSQHLFGMLTKFVEENL